SARARAVSPICRARSGVSRARCSATSGPLAATRISLSGSKNTPIPSQESVMMQAPAPAASKTRVAGLYPYAAMLSRLTLRIGRGGMVSRRVEPVIDRHAEPGAKFAVAGNHRLPAAISEHDVVFRDQRAERVPGIGGDAVQRGRRIDIPERGDRPASLEERNA